jgi:hypothetical protein
MTAANYGHFFAELPFRRVQPPRSIRRGRIRIGFRSPVEAFITDPTGRQLGFDPRTGTDFNGIPGYYGEPAIGGPEYNPPDPPKVLEAEGDEFEGFIADGDYIVTVVGTRSDTYAMDVDILDNQDNTSTFTIEKVPTAPGVVHRYQIHFSNSDAKQFALSGGFDGAGQRPRDVNHFLSYANPSESHPTLPQGSTSFPLVISYDAAILPATFSATLNGQSIRSLFHPTPSTTEVVNLNGLGVGSNVLILSIDGTLATGRIATDTDRLVLKVP